MLHDPFIDLESNTRPRCSIKEMGKKIEKLEDQSISKFVHLNFFFIKFAKMIQIKIALIFASILYVVNCSGIPPPESGLIPLYDPESSNGIGVLAVAYWMGTETLPWADAQALCLSYDMKLAQPTTTSSAEKIKRTLAAQSTHYTVRAWMGLCGDPCGSPVNRWCWLGPPKAAMDEQLDVYWPNGVRPPVYTGYCSFFQTNSYGSSHHWSTAPKSSGMVPLCEY